jgi:integrase/recombinase XerD
MIDYTFKSLLGPCIKNFISHKHALGYPYHSPARTLYHFDLLAAERFPEENTITQEMCSAWILKKPGEHPNGLLKRITPLRQLSKYMKGLGYDVYVIPNHIPNKQIKYEAHIYTDAELKAFFNAIDHCPASPLSPTARYIIPIIFRMLYCCGLRSSEARLLKKEDVSLETGKIIIRASKGWKARIVYMSEDLLAVCRDYDSIMESILPDRYSFFPNRSGHFFNYSVTGYWFHKFWDKLPESKVAMGNPARVHDFRYPHLHKIHTF